LAIIGVVWLLMAVASAAASTPKEDLFALLRQREPSDGAVHAVYVEPAFRELVIVGYDFRTGAWYKAFKTFAGGVEPSGTAFTGTPTVGGVHRLPDEPKILFDTAIEDHFPFVIARDFVRRPEIVRDVERVNDRFRVVMRGPGGNRWFLPFPGQPPPPDKDVTYWIDSRGLVVQADGFGGNEGQQTVWDYNSPESVKWGIADSVNSGTRIRADLRTSTPSVPSQFSMEEIEKLAAGAFLIADRQPLWFGKSVDAIVKSARAKRGSPQEFVPPGGGSGAATTQSTPAPDVKQKPTPREVMVIDPRPADRTTTWLAAAGVGAFVLAGIIWWRRRQGA
jgi:hypothetical protein